jgi:uncharacterized glyoxalase superfamily protein PhnB
MHVHEMFPYIRVRNAEKAIEFYVEAFGAKEKFRLVEPTGRIGHAELELGGGVLMISDEYPEHGILGPESVGATTFSIHLHVDDADALIASAVAAGAELVRPAADHFYGERSGTIRDPFGHQWLLGHHLEEVTPEEMQRRYDALFA